MNRETIDISDLEYLESQLYLGNIQGFNRVEFQLLEIHETREKLRLIVQSLEDDKFYKIDYYQYEDDHIEIPERLLTEVFPKQITTTIYE